MIKALYSVKYRSNAYRVSILVGIPCDPSGNLSAEYRHSEIAVCGIILHTQWGSVLGNSDWIIADFNLNPEEFSNYRVKTEELGDFDSPGLAVAIAVSTLSHYRDLLTLISNHYHQASQHNQIATLG